MHLRVIKCERVSSVLRNWNEPRRLRIICVTCAESKNSLHETYGERRQFCNLPRLLFLVQRPVTFHINAVDFSAIVATKVSQRVNRISHS